MSDLCNLMDCGLPSSSVHGILCPWDSPGENTGVGCHFLLQRIFLTQESNPGLLHYKQILYQLSYEGSQQGLVLVLFFKRILKYICYKNKTHHLSVHYLTLSVCLWWCTLKSSGSRYSIVTVFVRFIPSFQETRISRPHVDSWLAVIFWDGYIWVWRGMRFC